jgi:hypothetical protein
MMGYTVAGTGPGAFVTGLNQVMMGVSHLDDLLKACKAIFDGDRKPLDQLKGILVSFAPIFEMLPGTAAKTPSQGPKPCEVPDLAPPDAAGD